MKGNAKRRHSCSECQSKELNQLEWEKHLKKYQKKWNQEYQKQRTIHKGRKDWRLGRRVHSCEWCQGRELNNQEWKKHTTEVLSKHRRDHQKNIKERQRQRQWEHKVV